MGRLKRETYEEIETLLMEGNDVGKVSKKTGAGKKVVEKIADSLGVDAGSQKEDEGPEPDQKESVITDAEFWKKRAEFWKEKYLETWADFVEIGAP